MQRKSETFEKFKKFHVEIKNHLDKSTKTLRCDRGGEYLDSEFRDHLVEQRILP